jgi:hypothetical protein
LVHGVHRETTEGELLAAPARTQLGRESPQWVATEDDIGRPVGGEQHQPTRFRPLRDVREHVERRRVAPVQILQDENDDTLRGDRFDRAAEQADRAFGHDTAGPGAGRSGCDRRQ